MTSAKHEDRMKVRKCHRNRFENRTKVQTKLPISIYSFLCAFLTPSNVMCWRIHGYRSLSICFLVYLQNQRPNTIKAKCEKVRGREREKTRQKEVAPLLFYSSDNVLPHFCRVLQNLWHSIRPVEPIGSLSISVNASGHRLRNIVKYCR